MSSRALAIFIVGLVVFVAAAARAQFSGMLFGSGGGAAACAPYQNNGTKPIVINAASAYRIGC